MSATKLQVSGTLVPGPDEAGFTLIELLVVLLLMGVLMTRESPTNLETAGAVDSVATCAFTLRSPARPVRAVVRSILPTGLFRDGSGGSEATTGAADPDRLTRDRVASASPCRAEGTARTVGPRSSRAFQRRIGAGWERSASFFVTPTEEARCRHVAPRRDECCE